VADVNANIGIHIDTSQSLAEIKNLQRQLAQLYTSINRGSAAAAAAQKGLATNLMNTINAGGKFYAQMGTIRTSTESFTHALEKNKLTMREYFRFAGGSTRTFGRLFKSEFDTIGRVAEERVKKMQTQYVKLGRDASGAMRAISITPTALNMKEYGNQVAVAAQKQALLNQLLRQGSTNLLNFGKNTQWAGRQLMVGFTIPLAYFGTAAAKTFMDLEAQAIKFRRVYGDMFTTTAETNKALADIQALAEQFTKYGVAVSKTMEMAAAAAAMGRTGAELTAQVAQATRLAVLGNVEQEEALRTTISLTDAFGLAAEDLTGKINFLNAVENQTVTAIEDLTVAIPKAGPVVKQLGGSVEDLAFFLTAMREGGINASEGANALKSGLASLINPTDKAAGMLADMGINIKDIVEANVGNLKQTVIDFANALDTLAPLERSRAIEQLFGKFQFARLSTLFENVTKDGGQAARVLDLAGKSVEELAILSERELGAIEDAIGTNFRESVEQLKLAIAPIGKEFLKTITPVVKFLGDLFEKFNNLSDGSKKFIVILTTLVGLVGPTLLMTFGLVANGAANIIKLFLLMRQGFLKLTGNSTNLAQQTQYLSSEQMEAAVVAASLNQAHTRLTQQFTLEASAVNQLRNAYVQATAAAARFAATNPGMMVPGAGKIPKKFASGTIKVPGYAKGTDSVPAMLTPGEAVIPEPIAQDDRFKPLIAALISGEIKKYNEGTPDAGSNFAHVGKGRLTDLDEIIAGAKTQRQKEQAILYRDILKAAGKPTIANAYGDLGFTFDGSLNRALATKNGISIVDFEKEWIQRGPAKWSTSPGRTHFTGAEIQKIDAAILDGIRKSGAKSVTDDLIDSVFKKLPPEIRATATYKSMADSHKRIGEYSLGRGLGSTPKSSATILEQAKKSGIIKNYYLAPSLDKDGKERPGKLGRLKVITNDGREVDLGRGSRSERIPFKQSAYESKIAAAKGEKFETKSGKTGVVTGQTGSSKPSGRKITASPRDTRVMGTASLARVLPYGVRGMRVAGAIDGYEAQTQGGVRQIPFSAAADMRVSQSKLQELTAAIKTNTDSQDDGTKVTEKSAKEIKKEQRAVKMQRMSAVGGPVAMAAGTAGMVAAMSGAPQTMTNFLFGISAVAGLLPLLANPIGIAVAAIAAVGVGMWKLSSDLKNASKEGAEFAKSVTMTNSKLVELSKITGSVSATESAKRQRQNILSGASGVQRKTGQTILESDFGKGVIKDIETQQKSGASDADVAKSVSLGLSTAIMQGVLTTEQARSLAAALGEKLGSYDIPAQISGNIVRLVGPNGERLDSQPLQVALEIKKQSMEQQAQVFQNAMSQRRKTLGTAGEFAVAGAMVGTGALAGGPVGAAVGAGVAIKMLFDQNKLKAENLKLDTAAIQLGFESVAQGQGLVDSLNKQYDNKIKQAKTEEEVNRLEAERKSAIDAVNKENAKTLDILIQQKDQFSPGAFDAAIKAAADTMYKEGPMAVFKDQTVTALSELENSKFKTMLQLGLASGEMDPNQILAFVNMAKENPTLQTNFDLIVDAQGMAEANVLIGLLEKSGANEKTYKIVTDFINANPKQFKDIRDAISTVSNVLPKYGVTVDINTVGLKQLQQIKTITNTLKAEKGPITQEIVAKYAKDPNNPDQSIYQGILDTWTTLVGSSETITKEMIIDFGATYSDPNVKNFFDASKGLSGVPEHIRQMAGGSSAQASAYLVGTGKGAQGTGKKTGKGTGGGTGGERDTTLDELLKRLKFIRKASIDAEKGVGELMRITKGKGLTNFGGVMQQLMTGPKGGFNREFISFLEGMDNATRKTYMTVKNGQVILTKQGKALKEAFNEKVIGEYQVASKQALQDTKAQGAALLKLQASGVDSATALEMVADANLAVAINSKNITGKELREMAADAKAAKDEVERLNLEVLNLAEGLKKDIGSAVKTNQALLVARGAGILDPEMLEYISKTPSLVNNILDQGIGSATAQGIMSSVNAMKGLEDQTRALINPAEAALESFKKLKDASFKVLDLRQRQAQAKFNTGMKRTVDSFVSLSQVVKDKFKGISLRDAIKSAEGDVDAVNNKISVIQDTQIKPIEIQIEAKERSIDDIMKALRSQAEGVKKGFKLPKAAYEDIAKQLKDEIDDLELEIEFEFRRNIDELQEESSDLSNDLTLMDRVVDGINKKYDKQAEALEKVASANQEILDQQRSQLDVASALTSGDIAAAARAAQEARAQAAARAQERAGKALDVARAAEIGGVRSASGMTREQIEQRQFEIGQRIYQLEEQSEVKQRIIRDIKDEIDAGERAREAFIRESVLPIEREIEGLQAKKQDHVDSIAKLEAQILAIQNEILGPLQAEADILQKEYDNAIDLIDQEKQHWEDELTHLEAATTETTKFATEADKVKKAFDAALEIYKQIKDKTVTITVNYAYGGGGGGGGGGDGDGLGSSTITGNSVVTGTRVVDGRTVVTGTTNSAASTASAINPFVVTGTRVVDGRTVITGTQNRTLDPAFIRRNARMYGGKIRTMMGGGRVKPIYRPMGGLIPYMNNGGFRSRGSDTVPAMLTPGEYVVNKASSKAFAPFLNAINESKYPSILAKNISNARPIYSIPVQTSFIQPAYNVSSPSFSSSPTSIANSSYSDNSSSVYNYSVGISVGGTNASPGNIAKAVMNEIKYLDSQRIRNQKVS